MAKKLTNLEVAEIIDCEGLGYAIESYLNPSNIADPELRALWLTAKTAMKAINKIIDEAVANDRDAM